MKRIFALVLALLLLLLSFAGCKKVEEEPDETTVATTQVEEEETLDPMLEAENFGGTFSILGREVEGYSFPYYELDGNSSKSNLDDKIFERNQYIQQKYNIRLLSHYYKSNKLLSVATTDSLAGEGYEYDAYLVPTSVAFQMASNSLLYSLEDIPYINLDKPYWDQSLKLDTSIANKHYFAHGHFSIGTYNAVSALYLNKSMIGIYDLDDPYQLVRDGKWTWEAMFNMCKKTTNIPENGEADVGQYQYGLAVGIYAWQPMFFSTGASLVTKDTNDMPQLNLSNVTEVIQEVNRVLNDRTITCFTSSNTMKPSYNPFDIFKDGRCLFMGDPLYNVPEHLIPSGVDYGILPIPKYIEEQDTYYSQTHGAHSTAIAVPKVNPDLNKTGKIIEDYAYKSTLTVYPEIMDVMIKHQSAQTEDDYEMLGIMFTSVRCDMGLSMSNELKLDHNIRDLIKANSTAIASTLAENTPTYQGHLDKLINSWISE